MRSARSTTPNPPRKTGGATGEKSRERPRAVPSSSTSVPIATTSSSHAAGRSPRPTAVKATVAHPVTSSSSSGSTDRLSVTAPRPARTGISPSARPSTAASRRAVTPTRKKNQVSPIPVTLATSSRPTSVLTTSKGSRPVVQKKLGGSENHAPASKNATGASEKPESNVHTVTVVAEVQAVLPEPLKEPQSLEDDRKAASKGETTSSVDSVTRNEENETKDSARPNKKVISENSVVQDQEKPSNEVVSVDQEAPSSVTEKTDSYNSGELMESASQTLRKHKETLRAINRHHMPDLQKKVDLDHEKKPTLATMTRFHRLGRLVVILQELTGIVRDLQAWLGSIQLPDNLIGLAATALKAIEERSHRMKELWCSGSLLEGHGRSLEIKTNHFHEELEETLASLANFVLPLQRNRVVMERTGGHLPVSPDRLANIEIAFPAKFADVKHSSEACSGHHTAF